jgi:hypothetical protein
VPLRLVRVPKFDPWLRTLPATVAADITDGVDYVCEHGRGAVLPDVRHRIQTSRHFPDMSEVRTDDTVDGKRWVMRVLVCFVDRDTTLLACLGGNKAGYEERTGRDWYDDHVPVADQIVDRYVAQAAAALTRRPDHEH